MGSIISYEEFNNEITTKVYKNITAYLINKIAENPDRYVGIFRPNSPELKIRQNITQAREISFGDFVEDIITVYLGQYYTNLPKKVKYGNKTLLFDQLFECGNVIYMVEQKMRDDHDSTKKDGQFTNFDRKINYLKENYPDKEIEAIMWFVDPSLHKNKSYYKEKMDEMSYDNVTLHLYYGDELMKYLDKTNIWEEFYEYLLKWDDEKNCKIELNFEKNWKESKEILLKNVTKNTWKKIINNQKVVKEILPILFPTGKYKEILKEKKVDVK